MTECIDRPARPAGPAPADPGASGIVAMTSAQFAAADFALEWLAEGALVAGQLGVIGGPKKSLKTSVAADLAISLATATPFLGRFAVPKARRTALFSAESGGAALRETAQRVCAARRVALPACGVL